MPRAGPRPRSWTESLQVNRSQGGQWLLDLLDLGFPACAGDRRNRYRGDRMPLTCLVEDGRIGRHRSAGARPAQCRGECLERMAEGIVDRRTLEAAVRHAVVAGRVAAHAVAVPGSVLDERTVAVRIPFIGQEVTRPLPAEDVVGRSAPGRALVILVAGEEVEEKPRVVE